MNLIKIAKGWPKNLVYRTNEYTYSFKNFRTITTFDSDIFNGNITLKEADEDQASLLVEVMDLKKKKAIPEKSEKKQEKKDILKKLYALFEDRKDFLMLLKAKYFQLKLKV